MVTQPEISQVHRRRVAAHHGSGKHGPQEAVREVVEIVGRY